MLDLHCDTASKLFYEKGNLYENNFSVDIKKLKKSDVKAQVFAQYIDMMQSDDPYNEFINMYNNFIKELSLNNKYIQLVTNTLELEKANEKGKIGAFISIEEGGVLKGSFDRLDEVYKLGVRMITLTWNYPNEIGYPNIDFRFKDNGLTDKGKDIVEYMENIGIIIDVSHLSDKGFYDVLDIAKKPFIASHSNARAVKLHPRNLTDEMIKKLSEKGGVLGINYCSQFLGDSYIAYIDDMVKHIKHIKNVGGIDVISLGSDFDGISNPVEIKNVGNMSLLKYKLRINGFNENEIDSIFYKNALRVFSEILK